MRAGYSSQPDLPVGHRVCPQLPLRNIRRPGNSKVQTMQLPLLHMLRLQNLLELPGRLPQFPEDDVRNVLTDSLSRSTPKIMSRLQLINPELPHLLVQLVMPVLHAQLLPVRGELLERGRVQAGA